MSDLDVYHTRLHEAWEPIIEEARQLGTPVLYIEPIGGGFEVLTVALSEDPGHWAWIGAAITADDDGPWIDPDTERRFVGGYAYMAVPGSPGDNTMSERVMVAVGDPTNDSSIAEAVRDAWRELKEVECPHSM